EIEWVFAVAPTHPLATLSEPLPMNAILAHRAVTVADSSRNLPPRSSGLLSGQETLTVPDLDTKLLAQTMGLGVGNLPRYVAEREAAAGRLVIKQTEEPKITALLYVAWRTSHKGRALRWFVDKLRRDRHWLEKALGPLPGKAQEDD
ncbi:MAG TPA: LysR substrate-binding domain-containing protein, partial [Burkholderiales bacterium]|nr:LysR substrate-binding domain-containing protein [Burkholderiales bacterium]